MIRFFYLEPADGEGVLTFEAGQFLTLRAALVKDAPALIRTHTVSSAPGEPFYRISVKREPGGQISEYLHLNLKVGDVADIKSPCGEFFIDPAESRPAVLLAGGVGITPMIAMAKHNANHGVLTRHRRPLTVLHATQSTELRAFATEFRELEQVSGGRLRYLSFVSQSASGQRLGQDFHGIGHIDTAVLKVYPPGIQ